MFQSSKKFSHVASAAFRQHKADSHCKFIHGYGLSFTFYFEADELDYRNWVVDFGGLKELKKQLEQTFDHKLVVAADDPLMAHWEHLQLVGGCELTVVDATGCESFAKLGAEMAMIVLESTYKYELNPLRVRVVSCEVHEHETNSAVYVVPT